MKLYYNHASPYARKVLVLAHEGGLAHRIELELASPLPIRATPALTGSNPLMKIPTLLLDDGSALYDSRVIVEYLDSLLGGKFIPASGAARWQALRLQALADGLLDALLLARYELALRPAEKQWPEWIDGQLLKVRQGLDVLESERGLSTQLTIAEMAVASALGYLDFRFAQENWRATRPALAGFYQAFAERPSMISTRPVAA